MFAASLAAMVLIAVAFTGCGKDSDNKGGGGANSVEWDPAKTVHPDQEGAAVLLVTGDTGTPWTAEIISGAEWISFNRREARLSRRERSERVCPTRISMSIIGRTTPRTSGMP